MNRALRNTVIAFSCLVALTLAGCTSHGDVNGKVTSQGKSVTSGTVTLVASDNMPYQSSITPDGTYSIPGVPRGPVKISVSSPNPGGATRGKGGGGNSDTGGAAQPAAVPSGWFEIAEKYSDPQKSGLTGTVQAKTTIDLKVD